MAGAVANDATAAAQTNFENISTSQSYQVAGNVAGL